MLKAMMRPFRPLATAAAVWLAFWMAPIGSARAACERAPEPEPAEEALQPASATASGPTERDGRGRVVAPVWVNGEGPFRFIIDTGANRSVLSARLAERLGLSPSGSGLVHTIGGAEMAPLIAVNSLRYGALSIAGAEMPILSGPVLAGEHGLLGVDGMAGRRLIMDFERRCVEIAPAGRGMRHPGWTRARGELRFGHLVIVQGEVGRVNINVLIDTGSDSSLANVALREALRNVRANTFTRTPGRAFTAGRPIVLEQGVGIPRLRIGDLEVRNIAAFVGDFHIFELWGLNDEPTLLVGMDVLSQARALTIDYANASVHFRVRPGSRTS